MGCFVVPAGGAAAAAVVKKAVDSKEKKEKGKKDGISWSRKLSWLNKMLWGGTALLAFEHIWHGEVVPWPPFLTAMESPAAASAMFHEMATIGTAMALFVIAVWAVMVVVADSMASGRVSEAEVNSAGSR